MPAVVEPPMDRQTLAARIGARCRLTGEFTVRSGQITSTYFDKYLFEADPELLTAIAAHLAELVPRSTDLLAGLELGGVPVATALSLATGLPVCFVRKKAKGYGTARLAEGADVNDRQVLIIEDVITTGGQVATSGRQLRQLGARIDTVLCVIDRSGGDHSLLGAVDISVTPLFTADELG